MEYKWMFTARDNGGKLHCYTIKAKDKTEAIHKGLAKAKKNGKGDLNGHWDCKMIGMLGF